VAEIENIVDHVGGPCTSTWHGTRVAIYDELCYKRRLSYSKNVTVSQGIW